LRGLYFIYASYNQNNLLFMNQVFGITSDKSWKSLLVTDDRLLLMNKSYSNPEEFMKGYNDESLGKLLKEKKEIEFFEITGLKHEEKHNDELCIYYNGNDITLEFSDSKDMELVAAYLASQRKFARNTETMTALQAIKAPGILLLITLVLGWIVYDEAKTLEAGGSIEISGRRALIKRVLAWFAETLGSTGTLITAGLLSAVFIFILYKRFKAPPNQVVYA